MELARSGAHLGAERPVDLALARSPAGAERPAMLVRGRARVGAAPNHPQGWSGLWSSPAAAPAQPSGRGAAAGDSSSLVGGGAVAAERPLALLLSVRKRIEKTKEWREKIGRI